MKKLVAAMMAICMVLAGASLAEVEDGIRWHEAEFKNGKYFLFEKGLYKVGPGESIPAGFYTITSNDLGVTGYLPNYTTIEASTTTVLMPFEVESFTADAGIYTVGEDFPAGKYSIETVGASSIAIYNLEDRLVQAEALFEDENSRIGQIELLDGYRVEVGGDACRFGAPNGISFD